MIFALLTIVLMAQTTRLQPPPGLAPLPTKRQLAWHDRQFYAFCHFGPNTFTGNEWGHGTEDPALFNPTEFDARQWVRIFRQAGMTGVVITAKHHDGFCLWPSKLSTHTVAQSPWRGGKGDVLKELSDACRAEGLKFGVYLSPWDRNHPAYGTPAYNQVFAGMLEEVLTRYGEVFEVWFDGANGEGPNGKKQVYDWNLFIATVRRLQPNACMFSDSGPDVRWVGNEDGHSAETCWSTLNRDQFYPGTSNSGPLTEGQEGGADWIPAECDVSIRPGWFYRSSEDGKVKSGHELVELWYRSVGQNANLILNVPPDPRGLIAEPDRKSLLELRAELDRSFRTDLARKAKAQSVLWRGRDRRFAPANVSDGRSTTYWATDDQDHAGTVVLEWSKAVMADCCVLQEAISLGQRVRKFSIRGSSGNHWDLLAEGTTIGYRRMIRFPRASVSSLRLDIEDSRACPCIANLEVYDRLGG